MQFQLISASLLALAVFSTPRNATTGATLSPAADVLSAEPAALLATALATDAGAALVVECPTEIVKVTCGMSYDPSVAGEPEVSGGCPPYNISYADVAITPTDCVARRFDDTVKRTWTITDSCGNSMTCQQSIHILKTVIPLDLHPRSCPNPFNRKSNGKFPAAINGTATFDVTTIIPGSLQLWGFDCVGGPIAPIPSMTGYEDVSAPYTGPAGCGCTTAGPDGFLDLIFKFDQPAMNAALNLAQLPKFTNVQLVVIGETTGGCRFIGVDCIRVQ